MTKKERIEWDELYQYVKSNIMLYDDKQALSRHMVLRLKGMVNGKFYANNAIKNNADYSFKIVLLTFKFCKPEIEKAIKNKTFTDEKHKTNYICCIVENNLNDVYMRLKNSKKMQEKTETMNTEVILHKGAEYTKKSSINKKMSDLW